MIDTSPKLLACGNLSDFDWKNVVWDLKHQHKHKTNTHDVIFMMMLHNGNVSVFQHWNHLFSSDVIYWAKSHVEHENLPPLSLLKIYDEIYDFQLSAWQADNQLAGKSLRYFAHVKIKLLKYTFYVTNIPLYSKTCVKRPPSKRQKIGFQDQLFLNAGQKYCRMLQREHSALLSTFIKLPFVIKIYVLSNT